MSETLIPLRSGEFKSFDGTSIYYEVRGEGVPVVFVYGIACLMNHFRFQIDHFAKTHKVITLDLRGHHKSALPNQKENMTLAAVAKDLSFLLRTLGLPNAHFVGHSFGVPALLACYDKTPSLFKTMTFINGFAKNPIKGMFGLDVIEPFFHFIKKRYDSNPVLLSSLWKVLTDNPVAALSASLAGGFNMKVSQFKDIEIYAKGVSQVSLDAFLPLFEDMMKFNGDEIAKRIEKPVLIMSGDRDFVTPQNFQHELHQNISGSELVTIPYGSHCCQLDFPEFVNLKLENFLEAHT